MFLAHAPSKSGFRLACCMVIALLLALPSVPAQAADQPSGADKDKRIAELEDRVRMLEQQIAKLQANSPQSQNPDAATRQQRDALIMKARQRARQDRAKHSPEELQECEQLYQVANKNWRSPEAKASLEKMLEKYPDVNRTGCALVYMGQMSAGEQKEQYLKQAIEKFSDCYYLNGVQVGGWARYLLASYYRDNNQPDKAKVLFDEIRKDYADAITHSGMLLIKGVERDEAATTRPAQQADDAQRSTTITRE